MKPEIKSPGLMPVVSRMIRHPPCLRFKAGAKLSHEVY